MPRYRWWLALALAVVLVGAAMPAFFTPDPARAVAKLAADVARLESVVRRGKPAANMRDLKDGNLYDAEDGQVPVYNAASGTWRPGTAGGNPAATFEAYGTQNGPLMRWTLTSTEGDTTWFEHPVAGDDSRIRPTRPGILIAVLNLSTWTGGPHAPSIRLGALVLASGSVGTSPAVPDFPAGIAVTQSFVDSALKLSVNTGSTTSAMYGRLTLLWTG